MIGLMTFLTSSLNGYCQGVEILPDSISVVYYLKGDYGLPGILSGTKLEIDSSLLSYDKKHYGYISNCSYHGQVIDTLESNTGGKKIWRVAVDQINIHYDVVYSSESAIKEFLDLINTENYVVYEYVDQYEEKLLGREEATYSILIPENYRLTDYGIDATDLKWSCLYELHQRKANVSNEMMTCCNEIELERLEEKLVRYSGIYTPSYQNGIIVTLYVGNEITKLEQLRPDGVNARWRISEKPYSDSIVLFNPKLNKIISRMLPGRMGCGKVLPQERRMMQQRIFRFGYGCY